MTRQRKIAFLGALYVAQGLPYGFQATALPVYLREAGVSLVGVSMAGLLALPWMLKALWAPLVDRYGSERFGRRKSWIVPTQAGLLLCTIAAAFVPEAQLSILLPLVLSMNLFAAAQDVAVDGLAVDLLAEDELGPGNAAQVIGYKFGMLTGGGLLVWASAHLGYGGLFGVMAAILAGVLALVLVFEEPPSSLSKARRGVRLADVLRALLASLRFRGAGWVLLFVGTYKLGETVADVMFKPFLVDAGFTAATIGKLVGTYGMAFSVLGSLLGGLLASRIDLWKAVGITAALRVLPIVAEWWLSTIEPTERDVLWVTSAEHLFGGMLTPCMFAFMMAHVDRRIGASHYTLLASLEVFGKAPAGWLSGYLVISTSYSTTFAVAVGLSVAFLLLLLPISRLERERLS